MSLHACPLFCLHSPPSSALDGLHRSARRAAVLLPQPSLVPEFRRAWSGTRRGTRLYQEVFEASWKEPEAFPDFVPGVIGTAAESGVLRLGILFLDDEPVSAQLVLLAGGIASLMKLHYVERLKAFSPGTICLQRLLREIMMSEELREIDFGAGTSTYKRWWMERERRLISLVAFNPKTAAGLATLSRFALRRTRQAIRESLAEHVVRPWHEWKSSGRRENPPSSGRPESQPGEGVSSLAPASGGSGA